MQFLRRMSHATLWVLAAVGVLCSLIWGATTLGMIKPLVVISGSMEPGIMTGDLLIATRVATDTLAAGDVVSLHSELNPNLITHRIETITPTETGYSIAMKGDNNAAGDVLDYAVGAEVWKPAVQLPGVGMAISRLVTPAVAIPLLLGLVGLVGLTYIIPPAARRQGHPVPA